MKCFFKKGYKEGTSSARVYPEPEVKSLESLQIVSKVDNFLAARAAVRESILAGPRKLALLSNTVYCTS